LAVSRWHRYWFADGGRIAAAYVRVAIALSVLVTLGQLATWSSVQLPGPPELYRPVGIWMLLGHTPPPAWLISALWVIAWTGSALMLLGLCTRAATVASFLGAVSLVSLSYASTATWSHQYNVVLLAQLAFLGARGGDALSLDAAIRRLRGLPPLDVPGGYQWSLRLVQLAIALMFAGAVFHKLLHGQLTLRWALSDNLRHHLLVRYDLAGFERPAIVDWLLAEVWRYRTAALLNMVAQLVPIFACVFVRRPIVRALCGAVWVTEVIGLGVVMSLWNLHWLPLAAVFVDWDRLNDRLIDEPPRALPGRTGEPARRRWLRAWIAGFVGYELVTAFVPVIDQKLNTYPFSGFPMFATIRAARPYDEHLPYGVPGDRFVVLADRPLTPQAQRWFDHANRRVHTITDPARLEQRLRAILAAAQRRYPRLGIRGLRHYLILFEAPAYPAPARFDEHRIAITGEIAEDGTFRSALGRLRPEGVLLASRGVDLTHVELVTYADDRASAHPLVGRRAGPLVIATISADPVYVVAIVDGTPWLVASRRSWTWK
jgi:hypothetical protein